MATFLYRLGRAAYRRHRLVATLWLLALLLAGVLAGTMSGTMSNAFSLPGTESQRALDLLAHRLPGSGADGASARVVFVADGTSKVTAPGATAAVERAVTRLTALPHVASVTDPFRTGALSPDGRTAYATVMYTVRAQQITDDDQRSLFAAGRTATSAGLRVDFGGEAAAAKIRQGGSEGIGLALAAIVLVITLGSLVAAGLPLLNALVGVGLGMLGISTASGFVEMSTTSGTLAMMLGLAVAIDYALFILSRYRQELASGLPGPEAAGRAVGTAGSAVVFAGATVVIALSALSVVGIPFLTAMGLAAAGTVAGSVLIALTLLPAMLGFLGSRVLGRAARRPRTDAGPALADATSARGTAKDATALHGNATAGTTAHTWGSRWAGFVQRRRVVVLLAVVAGLGVLAVPAADMRLGMPSDGTAASGSTQRRAYDEIAAAFGPGADGPLVLVTDLTEARDRSAAVATLRAGLTAVPGVAFASPPVLSPRGDLAIQTVVPTSGPDDARTGDLVRALRDRTAGWRLTTGAPTYVTGATAVAIDVSRTLDDALLPYLAIVVGLALILLLLVFRSLVVPVKATLGFLLSMAATFGAVVAVFQKGWGASLLGVHNTGPILSFLPILLVGLLFGLAMDYEVFLVTRMREEHVHGADAQVAVTKGLTHGARVVTAAATIMVGVFSGFMLSDETIVKSMGFALAAGVLFDAFLVRMTLVPAVMSLLGERAWSLPRALDRVLPDVDVEGARLAAALAAPSAGVTPPWPPRPQPGVEDGDPRTVSEDERPPTGWKEFDPVPRPLAVRRPQCLPDPLALTAANRSRGRRTGTPAGLPTGVPPRPRSRKITRRRSTSPA